jgi:hypothetical protein
LYAAPGTDGCDYIDAETFKPIPFSNFYTPDVHQVRLAALNGSSEALKLYEGWINKVVEELPGVHHYSWYDIERKIHTYKNYWSKHWQSIFNLEQEDSKESNMFFDKPWAEVSDQEIKEMAEKLESEMGGWIFHQKVNFQSPTPHIKINKNQPAAMIGG